MQECDTHEITMCTSCRHKGTACHHGYELIERLRRSIEAAGDAVSDSFEISGVACVAGCDHPCTVAYYGTRTATYLFGDVDPDVDIDDLVAYARHCADMHDGWSYGDRAETVPEATLTRIPAAMIAIEASGLRPC